jgi:DNA-binding PadR family transcriptional regulator
MPALVDRIVIELNSASVDMEDAVSIEQLKRFYSHIPQGEIEYCIEKLESEGIVERGVDEHGVLYVCVTDAWVERKWEEWFGPVYE